MNELKYANYDVKNYNYNIIEKDGKITIVPQRKPHQDIQDIDILKEIIDELIIDNEKLARQVADLEHQRQVFANSHQPRDYNLDY
jgi:uncharacterized membrane protein YcaP (DUF421 family)